MVTRTELFASVKVDSAVSVAMRLRWIGARGASFSTCLMEADDPKYLNEWIAEWSDLVEFEVYPVMSSQEAAERVSTRL
jgi:hypothetical protein